MGIRLLVANLSDSVNNLRLEQLFSPHGIVNSAQVAIDPQSGARQGNAFVEMASDEEAQRAMAALQGRVIDDQALNISCVATDVQPRLRPRYGNGRSGGSGVRSGRRS